jgi:hypothetical protein
MTDDLPEGCIPIDQPLCRTQRKWLRVLYGPWDAETARLLPAGFLSQYRQRERRDLLRSITAPPQAYGWTQRRDDDLAKALDVSERTVRRYLRQIYSEE